MEEKSISKLETQKRYEKRTNYAAQEKYHKEKTKGYAFRVMMSTEQDIIQKLDSVPNKAGYIKQLIREDMKREKTK